MPQNDLKIFALNEGAAFTESICEELSIPISSHEQRTFEDGENKLRPLCSVRGDDVYVVQSLFGEPGSSVHDKLCRLLFFISTLRDAGARRTTAVLPYLCYARKDRRTKPRDPVTTRYLASLFEAAGTDRVVSLDVHNPAAFQNAFRCATEHLEAAPLFVEYLQRQFSGKSRIVVASPDVGGIKRAEAFRLALAHMNPDLEPPTMAFVEKYRSAGVVSGKALVGDVGERIVVLLDDLISSGTTLAKAAHACHAAGARTVYTAATHALFDREAPATLSAAPIDEIVVTDSVKPAYSVPRVHTLSCAPLLARAIKTLHRDGSIVDLLSIERSPTA